MLNVATPLFGLHFETIPKPTKEKFQRLLLA